MCVKGLTLGAGWLLRCPGPSVCDVYTHPIPRPHPRAAADSHHKPILPLLQGGVGPASMFLCLCRLARGTTCQGETRGGCSVERVDPTWAPGYLCGRMARWSPRGPPGMQGEHQHPRGLSLWCWVRPPGALGPGQLAHRLGGALSSTSGGPDGQQTQPSAPMPPRLQASPS